MRERGSTEALINSVIADTVFTDDPKSCDCVEKIAYYNSPFNIDEVRSILGSYFHVVGYSLGKVGNASYGEITFAGINKATGIEKFMEAVGAPISDSIAIGDSENDLEMLEFAGYSVCMGNGYEKAKARADLITTDIDDDGIIELPSVQGFLPPPEGAVLVDNPYLIQWYNLQTDGTQVEKMTTYHSFTGGWYVRLDPAWQTGIFVTRDMDMVGNQGYVFSCRDESDGSTRELFAIYARSGDQSLEGLIKLAQKDDVVYAAQVLEGGAELGMTEDTLKDCFKFIQVDWKTGET